MTPNESVFGDHFSRDNGTLCLSSYPLDQITRDYGTPIYVYDFDRIRSKAQEINQHLKLVSTKSRAFFAVKALGNLSVLKLLNAEGLGMDVVSGGEIERCLAAGIPSQDIIFSGVAKSREEITLGITRDIGCFNIESPHEVPLLIEISERMGRSSLNPVNVALRINPDVDGQTHKKINTGLAETKFGLSPSSALALAKLILRSSSLRLSGLSCHIGSQILDLSPFQAASAQVKSFAEELIKLGAPLAHIDMGGGLGVRYHPSISEAAPTFKDWINVAQGARPHQSINLFLEPGRSIVADAGVLLTKVIAIKAGDERDFALLDAGMTELMRPALYEAYHHIVKVKNADTGLSKQYDVVGPVCETSCIFGENIELRDLRAGDYLAILTSGAYGMSMTSNYNSRPRPAEIAIEGRKTKIIRPQEALSSLWETERS